MYNKLGKTFWTAISLSLNNYKFVFIAHTEMFTVILVSVSHIAMNNFNKHG